MASSSASASFLINTFHFSIITAILLLAFFILSSPSQAFSPSFNTIISKNKNRNQYRRIESTAVGRAKLLPLTFVATYHDPNPIRTPTFVSSSAEDSASTTMTDKVDSLDPELLQQILDVAMDASRKAASIIMEYASGADVVKRKANTRDLLTEIDPLCEKTIRETVLAEFPKHAFLGEEDVPPGAEASAAALDAKLKDNDWLWIVDPIDGTTNFVHGMPLSMPSVACAYKGQVVVGVIYDPHRDELFSAIKGQGATLNGQSIKVGEQATLGDAIIAMGSPPGEKSMEMSLKGVAALMPKVRTIRMLGSAALMLAWVANGRLTAYWEYDLSSWDIAAGALIIKEAGGTFTNFEGVDFDVRNRKICGSNGKIHTELLKELSDAGIQ